MKLYKYLPKDEQITLLEDKVAELQSLINKLEDDASENTELKETIKKLNNSNHYLSNQLVELKDLRAGQEQFMDALENIIADHGFKLVEISA